MAKRGYKSGLLMSPLIKESSMNTIVRFVRNSILMGIVFLVSSSGAMVPGKKPMGLNATLMSQWSIPVQAAHSQGNIFNKKLDTYCKHAEHRIKADPQFAQQQFKPKINLLLDPIEVLDGIRKNVNNRNPSERDIAYRGIKEVFGSLICQTEEIDKLANSGLQQAGVLALVKMTATLVEDFKGVLIRAIGSEDSASGIEYHLKYWKEQESHLTYYKWHRSPLKMFNRTSAENQVRAHIEELKQRQDKYYEILGTVCKQVDTFNVDASVQEQYAWIASVMATINVELFEQKSGNQVEQLNYSKLCSDLHTMFNNVRNYNQVTFPKFRAIHQKPYFVTRNWLAVTAGVASAAAIGFYCWNNRAKIFGDDRNIGWTGKLKASFNDYVIQPLKDIKNVMFGEDLEKEGQPDNGTVRIQRGTDRLNRVLSAKQNENRDAIRQDFEEKVRGYLAAVDAQGTIRRDAQGRIVLDDNKVQQLQTALRNLQPAGEQPIVINDAYIAQAAQDYVRPQDGNFDRPMNLLAAVLDERSNAVGSAGDQARQQPAAPNQQPGVGTRIFNAVGGKLVAQPVDKVNRLINLVDGPIRQQAFPAITDIITNLILQLQGTKMLTKEISDATNEITQGVKEETDALLAQGKRIYRANRFTFTMSALLPSLAAVGVIGWVVKKVVDYYRRVNYAPVRMALVDVGQLLNRYEDTTSTNKDFEVRDYGRLIYLLDRLRHYNDKLVPVQHKERFMIDIESLEDTITAQQKMRIIDLMYRSYDFLSPNFRG